MRVRVRVAAVAAERRRTPHLLSRTLSSSCMPDPQGGKYVGFGSAGSAPPRPPQNGGIDQVTNLLSTGWNQLSTAAGVCLLSHPAGVPTAWAFPDAGACLWSVGTQQRAADCCPAACCSYHACLRARWPRHSPSEQVALLTSAR